MIFIYYLRITNIYIVNIVKMLNKFFYAGKNKEHVL